MTAVPPAGPVPDPGPDPGPVPGHAPSDLLEPLGSGIFAWKGAPRFGRQDLGYSPGGAQDRFSYRCGNIMLETRDDTAALEIVLPPRAVRFTTDCWFVLTGGRIEAELAHGGSSRTPAGEPIEHAAVYPAPAGSELRFGQRVYGWRTYLCCRPVRSGEASPAGRRRGAFSQVFRWPDAAGRIRLLKGPEYDWLEDPDAFLRSAWMTTNDMSDMGVRLSPAEAGHGTPVVRQAGQMVSAPVCDGTIQMTANGPIVLLRERQTVGGYPRAFVVISADVDLLAQFGPGQRMRFVHVTVEAARAAARAQEQDLRRLAERMGNRRAG